MIKSFFFYHELNKNIGFVAFPLNNWNNFNVFVIMFRFGLNNHCEGNCVDISNPTINQRMEKMTINNDVKVWLHFTV